MEVSGDFFLFQDGTIPNGMASNSLSIEYAEHGLTAMDFGGHVSKDLWSTILMNLHTTVHGYHIPVMIFKTGWDGRLSD